MKFEKNVDQNELVFKYLILNLDEKYCTIGINLPENKY